MDTPDKTSNRVGIWSGNALKVSMESVQREAQRRLKEKEAAAAKLASRVKEEPVDSFSDEFLGPAPPSAQPVDSPVPSNFNGVNNGDGLLLQPSTSSGFMIPPELIAPSAVKQEPELEIDFDDNDTSTSEENSRMFELGPHPLAMVQSQSNAEPPSDTSEGVDDEALDEFNENNWLRLVNKKAQCLVCNGPCRVTRNRKIPTLPFCKKCKKSYFYQLSQLNKTGEKQSRLKCIREGDCETDFQKFKCTPCFMKKFSRILKSRGGWQSMSQMESWFEEESESDTGKNGSNKTSRTKKRSRLPIDIANDEKLCMEPMVKLRKLTEDDLESFGATLIDPTVKQEPIDIEYLDYDSTDSDDASHYSWKQESESFQLPASYNLRSPEHPKACAASQSLTTTRGRPVIRPDKYSPSPASYSKPQDPVHSKPQDPVPPVQGNKVQKKNVMVNEETLDEPLAILKVYVFTCGHSCSLCNSSRALNWLAGSGLYPVPPDQKQDTPTPTNQQFKQIQHKRNGMMPAHHNYSAVRGDSPASNQNASSTPQSVPHLKKILEKPPVHIQSAIMAPQPIPQKPVVTTRYFIAAAGQQQPTNAPSSQQMAPQSNESIRTGLTSLRLIPSNATQQVGQLQSIRAQSPGAVQLQPVTLTRIPATGVVRQSPEPQFSPPHSAQPYPTGLVAAANSASNLSGRPPVPISIVQSAVNLRTATSQLRLPVQVGQTPGGTPRPILLSLKPVTSTGPAQTMTAMLVSPQQTASGLSTISLVPQAARGESLSKDRHQTPGVTPPPPYSPPPYPTAQIPVQSISLSKQPPPNIWDFLADPPAPPAPAPPPPPPPPPGPQPPTHQELYQMAASYCRLSKNCSFSDRLPTSEDRPVRIALPTSEDRPICISPSEDSDQVGFKFQSSSSSLMTPQKTSDQFLSATSVSLLSSPHQELVSDSSSEPFVPDESLQTLTEEAALLSPHVVNLDSSPASSVPPQASPRALCFSDEQQMSQDRSSPMLSSSFEEADLQKKSEQATPISSSSSSPLQTLDTSPVSTSPALQPQFDLTQSPGLESDDILVAPSSSQQPQSDLTPVSPSSVQETQSIAPPTSSSSSSSSSNLQLDAIPDSSPPPPQQIELAGTQPQSDLTSVSLPLSPQPQSDLTSVSLPLSPQPQSDLTSVSLPLSPQPQSDLTSVSLPLSPQPQSNQTSDSSPPPPQSDLTSVSLLLSPQPQSNQKSDSSPPPPQSDLTLDSSMPGQQQPSDMID